MTTPPLAVAEPGALPLGRTPETSTASRATLALLPRPPLFSARQHGTWIVAPGQGAVVLTGSIECAGRADLAGPAGPPSGRSWMAHRPRPRKCSNRPANRCRVRPTSSAHSRPATGSPPEPRPPLPAVASAEAGRWGLPLRRQSNKTPDARRQSLSAPSGLIIPYLPAGPSGLSCHRLPTP